jgi:hypothetical protein
MGIARGSDSGSGGSSLGNTLAHSANKAANVIKRQSPKGTSRRTSTSRSSSGSTGRNLGRSLGSTVGRSTGGGGGSIGGSGGSSRPLPVPSLNSYLAGDSVYQNSLRGGKQSMADFTSDIGRRRGEATTQYNQTVGSMNRDRDQQLGDLRNEFASRGLIQSGLYGQAQGDFQSKFTEQQNSLQQQQAALLADLLSQQTNYSRENGLAAEQARQEALQRRAAQYKIGA